MYYFTIVVAIVDGCVSSDYVVFVAVVVGLVAASLWGIINKII